MSKTYQCDAQRILAWLRSNGMSLGILTGHDTRALRAATQIVDVWLNSRSHRVAGAFGTIVAQMQPKCRYLAYHAIAMVGNWSDRQELWDQAGLGQDTTSFPECSEAPRRRPVDPTPVNLPRIDSRAP